MVIFFVYSCGMGSQNDSELLSVLSELAPTARELYGIIYGDELPHETEAGSDGYYAVSNDAEYQSVSELKTVMIEVFSSGYLQVLYNTAFNGVSSDEGTIGAKFIEKDGRLYVNPDSTNGFGKPREFDLINSRVVKSNRYKAIIAVPYGDGVLDVSMQKDNGKWKIDSAIY
jgi:hypothetical protein